MFLLNCGYINRGKNQYFIQQNSDLLILQDLKLCLVHTCLSFMFTLNVYFSNMLI